jgi:hypothetical protein
MGQQALLLFDNCKFQLKHHGGGERMNKKILGIIVVLMAIAMLATPVMATSPKKIPVTIAIEVIEITGPTEFWVTAGNVAHGRGDTLTVDWSITGEGIPTSLSDGTAAEVGIFNANLNNPGGTAEIMLGPVPVQVPIGTGIRIWKMVIDFGDGNTFEGQVNSRGIQWVATEGPIAGASILWDGTQHGVLQGKGDYKGWTLVWETLRVEGVDVSKEAYMLIP